MRRGLFFGALVGCLTVSASVWAQPIAGDGGVATTAAPEPTAATPAAIPTTTAATTAATPASNTMTGEQYVVRLRDLEQRINELKEEIFRSKARLSLLAESVLQNSVGGSRAQIVQQNEMGGSYRLVSVVYALDGAPILNRSNDEGIYVDQRQFQVYNGQLGSGDHSLGVTFEYLGAGLPYMKGYRFRVRSTQSFSVPEGKAIQIRVVGYEKGGPLEPPENRPAIRYVQRIISLREASELGPDENANNAAATTSGAGNGQ
ncbi:MAG: hypothetical protein JNK72_04170 [Myxococcales bacterium]|nr:hypothetical protein [Myxococcales bacterium]